MNRSTSRSTPILPPELELRLFGVPKIRTQNQPNNSLPTKAKALLAYLAVTQQRQSRTTLAHLLWEDMDEPRALANLRKVVQKVRDLLPNHIDVDRHSVLLTVDHAVWIDVLAFETELSQALLVADANGIEKALRQYTADFLAGFYVRKAPEFEAWQAAHQARLREMMVSALKRLSQIFVEQQDLSAAIDVTQRILEHEPWREESHRVLMLMLAQNGETAKALLQYEVCRQMLASELGVPPSDATNRLYEELRRGKTDRAISVQEEESEAAALPPPSGFPLPHRLGLRTELRSHKRLFGVQTAHDALRICLLAQERPWLVAIDGIGGIGKTALAQGLVTDLSESSYFEQMAWVSAKQEEFQTSRGTQTIMHSAMGAEHLVDAILAQLTDANEITPSQLASASTTESKETLLRKILTETPTLIVVDNLETVADYEALLPTLHALSNPSKFLITSRYALVDLDDVFSQTLAELPRQDVFDLLRHEATMRGIASLIAADEDALDEIYRVAGGHPLTLNLILGQLKFLPLEHVLDGLRNASTQRTESLYTYIYRQAWALLEPPGRQLFCAMPLLQNATYAQLCAITQLPEDDLHAALAQLIGLSLLHVDGDLFDPRYSVHRLTETFLSNEVRRTPEQSLLDDLSAWHTAYEQMILNGLRYWHDHPAVQTVEVEQLDRNLESILNLLGHGLLYESAWPDTRTLIFRLTSYMERRGHWQAWRTILARGVEMAQNANDIDGETTLTALLGRLSTRQGREKEVVARYRRSLSLAKPRRNRYEIARAYSNLGYFYIDRKYRWRAEVLNLAALEIFEELENAHGIAWTCNHLGMLYTRQNQWELAQNFLERACQLWRDQGAQHALLAGYTNLGMMYVEMGEIDLALENLDLANRISQRTGELANTAQIWNNMALAHRRNETWREAEECAKKAESLFHEYADERGLADVWLNLGMIYVDINQKQRAAEYFDNALHLHRKFDNQHDIERIRAKMNEL